MKPASQVKNNRKRKDKITTIQRSYQAFFAIVCTYTTVTQSSSGRAFHKQLLFNLMQLRPKELFEHLR